MDARESSPLSRAAVLLAARRFLFSALLATLPFCTAAARAQEEELADADPARVSVSIDTPAAQEFDLSRADAAERIVYEVSLDIPGRKIPLTARVPLEAGQTNATLSLSVQEREGRHASTLALAGGADAPPSLPLGLFSSTPVEVALTRADASAAATYSLS
ncbi:MAG: hypothetical protein J6Y19_04440, partial [Kiritimatiellae bacterium]|nr:hypothetical protein [Kiritimatiellia bacterium]